MSLKFASAAHVALAQLAAEHPGDEITAVEIRNLAVAAGFRGNPKIVIAGDHAVQPDGRLLAFSVEKFNET